MSVTDNTFYRTLGLPELRVHHATNHFDFTRQGRRILVVGPMGSGKTGFAAQIWRDSRVVREKDSDIAGCRTADGADLRNVFFVRSRLDSRRFSDYPKDALAYRGGYEKLGPAIAEISSSFELEDLVHSHPEVGTWIIDEASFYDERIAYVIQRLSVARGLVFVFPTLILNFRNAVFNTTAQLLLEITTDVFPLTAYCEHRSCLRDSSHTYRYYLVDGDECPAMYFDPLIIIGGDRTVADGREPNYATRCAHHHILPGKEYTFLVLKPLAEAAVHGDPAPLEAELSDLKNRPTQSQLGESIHRSFPGDSEDDRLNRNALRVPCLAERALSFLFAEQNIISELMLRRLVRRLQLDTEFLSRRLADNRRPVDFSQEELWTS
ncbi:MAG: thymidine kinase [Alkalispirochaeta sp.]